MEHQKISKREEEQDILFGVINRFIGYFTRQAVPNTINDTDCEYPFVAMDTRQAYQQICVARDYFITQGKRISDLSFIDIGCGIGNILLLAEMMEFQVSGIEKDTASLATARELVGEDLVSEIDIWQFDKLGSYDLIYYFRPFSKKELQVKFEHMVENKLKPGGILIANRKMDNTVDSKTDFTRITPELPVWYKKF